jgi:hypothetical protein
MDFLHRLPPHAKFYFRVTSELFITSFSLENDPRITDLPSMNFEILSLKAVRPATNPMTTATKEINLSSDLPEHSEYSRDQVL